MLGGAARELCEEIELPSFIKTSGSTGLHVLVPLGRQCTFEQLGQAAAGPLALLGASEAPL